LTTGFYYFTIMKVIYLFFLMLVVGCLEKPDSYTNSNSEQSVSEDTNQSERSLTFHPQGGEYLELVYIGDPGCAYCTDESSIASVNHIISRLEDVANQHDKNVWLTGVIPTTNFEKAVEFVNKIGPFSEISIGGGYFNLGHLEFIYGEREFSGPGLTPQILILETSMQVEPAGMAIGDVNVERRLINRYLGADEILHLSEQLEGDLEEINNVLGL